MQPADRNRILRGLGMGFGSLLLLSGAVFASQSGHQADKPRGATATGSERAHESAPVSASANAFPGGEVEDTSHSPDASAGDDTAEDGAGPASPSGDEDPAGKDEHAGPGADDERDRSGDDPASDHEDQSGANGGEEDD